MANTPTVYVICSNNCKYEGLTKEQILTAITQAVNEGSIGNIDTGFVTTIKTINGLPLRFFVGTQPEYEALTEEQKQGLYAIITNDTTASSMADMLTMLDATLTEHIETIGKEFANIIEGAYVVGEAKHAEYADRATELNNAGLLFGRKLLYRAQNYESNNQYLSYGRQLPLDGTEITFDIDDVSNKFLVVEIRNETGETYDSQTQYIERTNAFNCKDASKATIRFDYEHKLGNGHIIHFWCNGNNQLCIRRDSASYNDTEDKLYIVAIYEEL